MFHRQLVALISGERGITSKIERLMGVRKIGGGGNVRKGG